MSIQTNPTTLTPVDDSESTEFESSDSRLTSFLRQAAGIIAGEKGMTPACQLKLQTLAEKIKLPPETFEKALRELESTHLDVEKLTRYEKAFVAFLDSELEKIQGDVLSPRMENAAIEIASNKFQIEPIRAWQLMDSRCQSSGVSRISPEEVKVYAKQSILACLGDRLFIDDETQALLYRIGKDWGLEPLAVDQITLSQVANNRNLELKDRSSRVVPLSIVLVGLVLIGGLGFVFWPELNVVQTPAAEVRVSSETEKGNKEQPDPLLSSDHSSRADRIRDYLANSGPPNDFSQWLQTFAPEESDPQSKAGSHAQSLAWLLDRVTADQAGQGDAELDLLSEIYLNEPNDQMASEIQRALAATFDRLTPTPENLLAIDRAIGANRIVHRIRDLAEQQQSDHAEDAADKATTISEKNGLAALRWQQLFDQLPMWYQRIEELEQTETQSIAISQSAIAKEQWSRFTTFAFVNPELASRALPNLIKATQELLSPEVLSMYRDDVLFAIVESQPKLVLRLTAMGRDSIRNADEPTLTRWANVLSAEGVEYEPSLAASFLERVQLQPHSSEKNDVQAAIFDFRNRVWVRRYRPLMERVERVSAISDARLEFDSRSTEARQLPNRIADLLVAVNLELALCKSLYLLDVQGEAAFEDVDQLLANANPNLLESVSLVIDRDRTGKSNGLGQAATASDFRAQKSTFELLASEEDRVEFQVNSVRQLARVASRLPNPTYGESEQLARFFLSDMPLKQRLELQQLIGSFSHWNSLALALADQLQESNAELERVLTVARILLRREFEIEEATRWQSELRTKILLAVHDDLSDRIARNPNSENSDWTRLEFFMKDVFETRLKLLRTLDLNPSMETEHDQKNVPTALGLVDAAKDMLQSVRGREWQSVGDLPVVNRFDHLALLNQLIIAELGNQLQDNTAFSEKQIEFLERLNGCANVGQRYFETERRLLELLQQWRSEKVSKVTG